MRLKLDPPAALETRQTVRAGFDMKAFRALPREEQKRQLRAQAESAAPMYEADLALPVHERELTAFSALDDDPLYEYPEDDAIGGSHGINAA